MIIVLKSLSFGFLKNNRWDNDAVKNSKKTYYNFFWFANPRRLHGGEVQGSKNDKNNYSNY